MKAPLTQNRRITTAIATIALTLVGVLGASVLLLTPLSNKPEFVLPINPGHFSSVTFSPDGTKLLITDWNSLRIWDLSTKAGLLELPSKSMVNRAEFAPDGQTFAIGKEDTTVTRWNLAGEQQNSVGYHHSYVSGLAYSPDGKWLATSGHSDCTTRLWNASTGDRIRDLTGHRHWAGSVAFSSDSQLLATGDRESVHLWEVRTGKLLHHLISGQPIHHVAFSPDGKTVFGSSGYGSLHAWEVATGKPVNGFSAPPGEISKVVFTPNGKYIITQMRQTILLLEAATGRKVSSLIREPWQNIFPLWLQQKIAALQSPQSFDVCDMALSPDGKRLAYSTKQAIRIIPFNFR